jgi:predicted ATPase/class 3 adenylate cyclase
MASDQQTHHAPPAGTVTLLFTDIEGSTTLLQRLGDRYQQTLEDHNRLVREAIRLYGGYEVDTAGDAFFVAFERARDAVACAVAAQQALQRHPWPDGVSVHVRMGIHTGEPTPSHEGYVGLDVNRTARISAAAWGGQIVLSRTTRALMENDMPEAVTLRDLGYHRLKDLEHPEHLYQVLHPALAAQFPPVRSLDALPNNLPRRLSSFIGREQEIKDVKRLLGATRLLSLIGPGGGGKTRLALQVAGDVLDSFAHGAFFIELAGVNDPSLVTQAVASALGVREEPARPLQATLTTFLRGRNILLILDNCEHLVEVVATLTDALLQAAPRLQIMCTSREALGIAGETAFRVPSLSLPDPRQPVSLERLRQFEAVRLFTERAADVAPAFALTEQNAAAVAQICRRLDGIPLAIELAASRVKVLTVEQIAARLDDRFRLLAGGPRTAMPRQQTLKAAMDWSYDLLTVQEAAVLRRLAVFIGGCTLEAAEVVCTGEGVAPLDVLDLLTRLVDKSLLVVEGTDHEVRYRLLDTVRQYGRDKLVESGEAPAARTRHMEWFLALAEEAAPELHTAAQAVWLPRLDAELDNLRAAIDWACADTRTEAALRLSIALWWYWTIRSHTTEGSDWFNRTLALPSGPAPVRALATGAAAILAMFAGNIPLATGLADEAVALARSVEAPMAIVLSKTVLAMVGTARGHHEEAALHANEAVRLARPLDQPWETAGVLAILGEIAYNVGDFAEADRLLREALALYSRLGDRWGIAFAQRWLGLLARNRGDYADAEARQQQSLALNQELGHPWGVASSLMALALVPLRQGDYARAQSLLEQSLAMLDDASDLATTSHVMYYLGLTWFYRSDRARAVEILEESLRRFRAIGVPDGAAEALTTLGRLALQEDDAARAGALAEEALSLVRGSANRWPLAYALRLQAAVLLRQGDGDRAERVASESLAIFREIGDRWAIAWSLGLFGEIALSRRDDDTARSKFVESMEIRRATGDRLGIAECLEGLAGIAVRDGRAEQAARMLGAAEAIREAIATPQSLADQGRYGECVSAVRRCLDPERLAEEWAKGRAMSPEAAADYALDDARVPLKS